jgi:hypothetical protein
MTCALCKEDLELKNSHIIPEWVFTDLYDEKHRFNVLSTLAERPRPHEQKGLREKLLCEDCEQQFSRYERYARGVVKGGEGLTVARHPGRIEIADIDYTSFKLFQISVLWRAGVASHRMFSRVKLGLHEEQLRLMLRREDPGKQTDYPCLIFGLTAQGKSMPDFIDQPTPVRLDGLNCYRFIFCGLVWVFFVAKHAPSLLVRQHVLSETGGLIIWIKPFEDLGYLQEFARDLHQLGRFPRQEP